MREKRAQKCVRTHVPKDAQKCARTYVQKRAQKCVRTYVQKSARTCAQKCMRGRMRRSVRDHNNTRFPAFLCELTYSGNEANQTIRHSLCAHWRTETRMWAVGSRYYKRGSLSLRTNRQRSFPRFVAPATAQGVSFGTNNGNDSSNFVLREFLSLPFLLFRNLSILLDLPANFIESFFKFFKKSFLRKVCYFFAKQCCFNS